MRRIKVLIVDDSALVRRLLTDVLSADPQVASVSAAPNAAVALAKLAETQPDVVTLDVEMPDVSGLELLAQIRARAPKLPVIMFSSHTKKAAATTLEALSLGATDYVTKPSATGSREAAMEHVRSSLLPRLKVLGGAVAAVPSASVPHTSAPAVTLAPNRSGPIELIAVGSSTGGPNALGDIFKQVPAALSVPVVVVQHMPALFTSLLATRLTATCRIPFKEANDGDELLPGCGWIAPGDVHMRVRREGTRLRIVLDRGAPENSCRPAVDVLFRSVAVACGGRSLAVVLTGMGQDGLKGCETIRQSGGQVIVQDEATSVVWGMPGAVARAGLAEKVLPLDEIPAEIVRRAPRLNRVEAPRVEREVAHARQ